MIEMMKLDSVREEISSVLEKLMTAQQEIAGMIAKLEMIQVLAGGQEDG